MKRRSRIEFISYSRRVTVRAEDDTRDFAEKAVVDIGVEALPDDAILSEDSGHETGADRETAPGPSLLRRLLRLPPIRKHSPLDKQNINKENEP